MPSVSKGKSLDDSDIERTAEYEGFIQDLIEFHDKRGTDVNIEPDLGRKRLDLLKLYKNIIELGGYDKVTEDKVSAYEMRNHWNKTPPPKERLEDRSAAGGPIMTRTEAYYNEPSPRPEILEETASPSPAPPTRNLRQIATPRQITYNNNENGSRTSTPRALTYQPPQPMSFQSAQSSFVNGASPSTFQYQPPSVNGYSKNHYFDQMKASPRIGSGVIGPPLMYRVALSLKSGLPAEIDWALHHLVRMSFEEGENLRLDIFPGLAEALLNKVSSIRDLIEETLAMRTVDGDKFANLQTQTFQEAYDKILEAALALRNSALLPDNARYLARLKHSRDIVVDGIDLPQHSIFVEMKHYCLDIAEAISPYLPLDEPNDRLYLALRNSLKSDDRGVLVASLRSIARLVIGNDKSRLQAIDDSIMERIRLFLLLDDEELVSACLDLLYQYTTHANNVNRLMDTGKIHELAHQLVRLMTYQAQHVEERIRISERQQAPPAPSAPPQLPPDILQELLNFNEPSRALKWLKVCYEEDLDADVTQIHLWQAYQNRFSEYASMGRPLLQAADFIKNVSTVFPKASAMVHTGPSGQRFVIRGIKPRETPVSLTGEVYVACKWLSGSDPIQQCGYLFPKSEDLYRHIKTYHLTNDENTESLQCHWLHCNRFAGDGAVDMSTFLAHVRTHMPDGSTSSRREFDEDTIRNSVSVRREITAVDEEGDAAGLALTAALVLRNLLNSEAGQHLLEGVEEELIRVVAMNKHLSGYTANLLSIGG